MTFAYFSSEKSKMCIRDRLYADDFRSYERTFSLITQVVGRSGRRELPGRAFLQTYQPDHPVLTAAARQDYPAFYKTEVETRRLLLYPPFCRLYCLGFWGENEAEVKRAGQAVLCLLYTSAWNLRLMEQ